MNSQDIPAESVSPIDHLQAHGDRAHILQSCQFIRMLSLYAKGLKFLVIIKSDTMQPNAAPHPVDGHVDRDLATKMSLILPFTAPWLRTQAKEGLGRTICPEVRLSARLHLAAPRPSAQQYMVHDQLVLRLTLTT